MNQEMMGIIVPPVQKKAGTVLGHCSLALPQVLVETTASCSISYSCNITGKGIIGIVGADGQRKDGREREEGKGRKRKEEEVLRGGQKQKGREKTVSPAKAVAQDYDNTTRTGL